MATVSASAPGPSSLQTLELIQGGRAREVATWRTWRKGPTRILLGEFAASAGRRLPLCAALILASTALEGVGILLIVPLLDAFLQPGGQVQLGALDGLLEPFLPAAQYPVLFAGLAVLMLLRALVLIARDTQLARLQWGFIELIKLGMFRRLAAASWRDVIAIDRPRLNRALGSDMVQAGAAVNAAMQAAVAALMLAGYCAFAFMLAPRLSLLTFGMLAAVGLAGAIFVRRAGAFGRAALGYDLRMEERASRFLAGLKLAKAQDLQAGFVAGYADASSASVSTRVAFVRTMSVSRQLAMLFGALAAGTAVLVAVLATGTDAILLITFVVLLSRTAAPIAQIQQGVQYVANALPIFAELHELGAQLPVVRADRGLAPQANPTARMAPSISFKGVCFTHRAGEGDPRGGIRAVDLDIAAGEFVGLAGPTGSGKSTILDLVAGLERPDGGQILFDGRELSETELTAHRGALACSAADPVLFGGTVRSNLSWAAPDADDDAMWRAIEDATATELVNRLGGGLDSRIDESGGNLSAGESQQIAIARALLRQPSLLLLDEATSSIDAERERRLLANLAALEPRRTILFVSHRPASFALCDRVITVSGGQLTSIRRVV